MRTVPLVRVGGVEIRVHPLLPVAVGLALWLGNHYMILATMVALTLHEVAHVTVARLLGVEVERLTLTPFGGVARMDALLDMRPRAEMLVALAGPASNLLMAMMLMSLYQGLNWPVESAIVWVNANLTLCVFNLLPVLPMDGGRALRAALSRLLGQHRATRLAAGLGCLMSLMLLGLSVYLSFTGPVPLSPMIIALCMGSAAIAEWRATRFTPIRSLSRKQEILRRERILPVRHLAALGEEQVISVSRTFRPQRYHMVTVLNKRGEPVGVVSERSVIEAVLAGQGSRTVGSLTSPPNDDTFMK